MKAKPSGFNDQDLLEKSIVAFGEMRVKEKETALASVILNFFISGTKVFQEIEIWISIFISAFIRNTKVPTGRWKPKKRGTANWK